MENSVLDHCTYYPTIDRETWEQTMETITDAQEKFWNDNINVQELEKRISQASKQYFKSRAVSALKRKLTDENI